jgi:hypothetical protein
MSAAAVPPETATTPPVTHWRSTRRLEFLSTHRGIYIGTLVLVCVFTLVACYRAYPYRDNVNEANSTGDDWLTYKLNAISILDGGLSMPAAQKNYHLPGGFFYNYFVAAVFLVSGRNSTHVYFLQALLLALSVGITTIAFKPYLNDKGAAIYFLALAVVTFFDMFCFYSFRLLSENLLFFLLPLFYLLFLRAIMQASAGKACLAGALLGLCTLCRQNLILLGPMLGIFAFVYLKGRPRRTLITLLFVASFCAVFSLLPLRNYAVTGQLSIPVLHYTSERIGWSLQTNTPVTATLLLARMAVALLYFAKRILFCAGLTTILGLPVYYLKLHWLFIWFGAGVYLLHMVKRRRAEFWEAFAIVFVFFYLAPLIAIADISNYGVRMIVPVIPVVMLLWASWLSVGENNKVSVAVD